VRLRTHRRLLPALLAAAVVLAVVLPLAAQTRTPGQKWPLARHTLAIEITSKITSADRIALTKAWLPGVHAQLVTNWRPLLPGTTSPPPIHPGGIVVLRVRISPRGLVRHLAVLRAAHDPALTQSVEGAVKSSGPFPPFPPRIAARSLTLRLTFEAV